MDLISQYLASPEFAEAIGNVVVIAIMATAPASTGRYTAARPDGAPRRASTPRNAAAGRHNAGPSPPATSTNNSSVLPPMREDRQTPARKGPPSWTPSRRSSSNLCAVRNCATSTPASRHREDDRRIRRTIALDRRTTLWCDEEGAIKNLKPNRTIRLSQDSRLADAGKPIIIRGTFVITGPHPQDGPLGLDDEQIGRYAAMFADPEAPCRLPDGKTFMIPVHPIG